MSRFFDNYYSPMIVTFENGYRIENVPSDDSKRAKRGKICHELDTYKYNEDLTMTTEYAIKILEQLQKDELSRDNPNGEIVDALAIAITSCRYTDAIESVAKIHRYSGDPLQK